MNETQCIIIALGVVIVLYCLLTVPRENIAFPFGPMNPDVASPFNAQAIYGQPSQLFQLSSNPDNAPYGAYRTLQAMQARDNYVQMTNPQWRVSDNFSTDGNAMWDLSLGNPPINAWDYL